MEFSNAESVPASGEYRCMSCGEAHEFERGDDFPLCDSCGDDNAGWESLTTEAVEENPDDELGF